LGLPDKQTKNSWPENNNQNSTREKMGKNYHFTQSVYKCADESVGEKRIDVKKTDKKVVGVCTG
jgi:hypothetical protein